MSTTIITTMEEFLLESKKENYSEEEDIILPDNIFAEIIYILITLKNIFKKNKNKHLEYDKLKRQIRFFQLWMKIK